MKINLTKKTTNKVVFDLKDKKILSELGNDARIPISKLSRIVSLSRDSVDYRIKNYIETGLIQGFKTVIDIKKFGFMNFHILLKINKTSDELESKIINKIKKLSFVRAILQFNGNYDYEIAMVSRDIDEFENNFDIILEEIEPYLIDYEILTITEGYKLGPFPKNFLNINKNLNNDSENNNTNHIDNKNNKNINDYKLDITDYKILELISNNARLKLFEIARHINTSADTVNYRIKRMLASGYIIKFIPVINYDILNYNVYVIPMRIKHLTKEENSKLARFFNTDPNILWAVRSIGKYNVLFYISCIDPKELHSTLFNLRSIFPNKITEFETLFAFEEMKFTYLPKNLIE